MRFADLINMRISLDFAQVLGEDCANGMEEDISAALATSSLTAGEVDTSDYQHRRESNG